MIKRAWYVLKINYDYALGFLFFVSYRFTFNYFLWLGRGVPPEPDDSYFYLATAKAYPLIQNFEDFRLIFYSSIIKLLSIFTGNDIEKAYQLNFYLGSIILFFCIAYLITQLEAEKKFRLILYIVISLYFGSGAYHGFYWVAPSFYQICTYLILIGIIFKKKAANFKTIFLLSLLFVFLHPTSILALAIFAPYLIFVFFFDKRQFTLRSKNILRVSFSMTLAFLIYYLIGKNFPAEGSAESFEVFQSLILDFLTGKLSLVSWNSIWREYFAIFFFSPYTIPLYFLMIFFSYFNNKKELLYLFASTLILVLLSSFVPYGERSLIFLWPITFLLIGYAIIGTNKIFEKNKFLSNFLTLLLLTAFVFLSTIFNLIQVKYLSRSNDYSWNRNCPSRIVHHFIYFSNLEALHAFEAHGISRDRTQLLTSQTLNIFLSSSDIFVWKKDVEKPEEDLSNLEIFLSKRITRKGINQNNITFENSWTQETINKDRLLEISKDNSFSLKYLNDCGGFEIYQVESKGKD